MPITNPLLSHMTLLQKERLQKTFKNATFVIFQLIFFGRASMSLPCSKEEEEEEERKSVFSE